MTRETDSDGHSHEQTHCGQVRGPAPSSPVARTLSGGSAVRTRVTNTSKASIKSRRNCSVPLSVTSPTSVIKPGVS